MKILLGLIIWGSVAVASPSVTPSSSVAPMESLNAEQKAKLLSEYKKALSTEEKAFQHQDRALMKELSAAQSLKVRNWRENERSLRKAFFEAHQSGPERRQFVQDYIKRKEQFDLSIKNESLAAKKNAKDKYEELKKRQGENLIMFQKQLNENRRPDISLWPNHY